jgi:hypothetical protein
VALERIQRSIVAGDRGIELLQLAYYLGAFVIWSVGIVVCVAVMGRLPG